jgi:membrane peptidoglycan carboxypeptidase
MNVAESIIFSNNTIPIRILLKHGLYEFFNLCKELSLFDHLSPVYSLALGTMESSVELMAFFIGLFKNKGYGVIPFDITHVFNNSAVLYRHEKDERNYLHEKECSLVHDVLLLSAQQIAQKLNIKIAPDIIAKTGTTNNMKVCWCIAADNHYSIALWFSTDINRSLSKTNIKTLTTAAQCAMEFFNTAYL